MVVSHAAQKVSWEEQVPRLALRQNAVLIADEHPAFPMHWASMQEFWKVLHTPLFMSKFTLLSPVACYV